MAYGFVNQVSLITKGVKLSIFVEVIVNLRRAACQDVLLAFALLNARIAAH